MPSSFISTSSTSSTLSNEDLRKIRKVAAKQANNVLTNRFEKKWYSLDIGNGPTLASPSFTDLTALISQGDQYNQRNGDQIRLRKVIMRFQSTVNASATWTGCRIMIVRSKGGALSVTDVLMPHVSLVPMYGSVNTAKVDIVYDRTYVLDTYGGQPAAVINVDQALSKALVQYPPGSSTAAKPLYLVFLTDALTLNPFNRGYFVLKYIDN